MLDEPNASLDQSGEEALVAATRRFRSFGSTIILITIKINVLAVADRIVVLEAGAPQAFGNRNEILKRLISPLPSRVAAV